MSEITPDAFSVRCGNGTVHERRAAAASDGNHIELPAFRISEPDPLPEHIRSDNGPEFIAEELRKWLGKVGTRTLYIEPGSPWENGYCESFNRKLRDEFLDRKSVV